MQQPKAVIRPTNVVEIPLQTHTFSSSLYPLPSYDQSELQQQLELSKSLSQSQPIYLNESSDDNAKKTFSDKELHEQPQEMSNPTKIETTDERQVLQSQVVIVQSGRQLQAGYPVQNQPVSTMPSVPPSYPSRTQPTVVAPQQPPMIVQPGGGILNPTLRQVLGHKSSSVKCPQCYHQVMTKVEYEPNMTTHCLAFILFIFLCWCCCCIPYCVNGTRNAQHYCPVCGVFLGLHEVELC